MSEKEPIYSQLIETENEDSLGMIKNKKLATDMAYAEKEILEAAPDDSDRPITPEEKRDIRHSYRGNFGEFVSILSGILWGKSKFELEMYLGDIEQYDAEIAEYNKGVEEFEQSKSSRANEAAERILQEEIFKRAYAAYCRELDNSTLNPSTAKHRAKEAAKREIDKYLEFQSQLQEARKTINES